MNVHAGRINRAVRGQAQALEEGALGADAVEHATLTLQRVRAALSLVTGDDGLVLGIQEEHGEVNIGLAQRLDGGRQIREQRAGAHVNTESHLRHASAVAGHQLGQGTEHLRGDVIDNVPAFVLEHVSDGATARTGDAGNHQNLRALIALDGMCGGMVLIVCHGVSSPLTRTTL